MAKVEEATEILLALGLPKPRPVAAYTVLALANMNERKSWKSAERKSLRIHDIIRAIRDVFKYGYAENTRENFRKSVLKPFEQARIADRNPDSPGLSTNSPKTHYALTEPALRVLRSHGTDRFTVEVTAFTAAYGSLFAVYAAKKQRHLVPVTLPSGQKINLTPGKHNELQSAVITAFAPRFAPGGRSWSTAARIVCMSPRSMTSKSSSATCTTSRGRQRFGSRRCRII